MDSISINRSILHILDYDASMQLFSQEELDLSDETIYSYILRHLIRLHNDLKHKTVTFREGSIFLTELQDYQSGKSTFVQFSTDIAYEVNSFMENYADRRSMDVLVVDYKADETPMTAILLLNNTMAYTHQTIQHMDLTQNTIQRHNAVLPSASTKIATYALVNARTYEIQYVDGMKDTEKETIPLMKDVVLQCMEAKSSEEVVKTVEKITTQVAEEFGENPTLLLSKAKTFIRQHADETEILSPEKLGEKVFEDHKEMKQSYDQKVEAASLPKQVDLPVEQARRVTKHQKIKTDTGIELSFPVEYFDSTEYISFINHPDGTISIELKHIGKITNKK